MLLTSAHSVAAVSTMTVCFTGGEGSFAIVPAGEPTVGRAYDAVVIDGVVPKTARMLDTGAGGPVDAVAIDCPAGTTPAGTVPGGPVFLMGDGAPMAAALFRLRKQADVREL